MSRDDPSQRFGCGVHRVFLAPRGEGGTSVLAELPWTQLTYGRKLDDMSAASVTLAESCVPQPEPFAHEVVVYRDNRVVWVGPVTEPVDGVNEEGVDDFQIPARDLFQWFERRWIPASARRLRGEALQFSLEDLAFMFRLIAEEALEDDPSPNIQFAVSPTGVTGTRSYAAGAFTRSADAMRELSRTAVDWTMRGRTMICGGREVPAVANFVLTGNTVVNPRRRRIGLNAASEVAVIGGSSPTGGAPYAAIATDPGSIMGLVQQVIQEADIADPYSVRAAARTHLAFAKAAPFELSCQLSPELAVGFDDLIPGTVVPVHMDLVWARIHEPMRLQTVDVSARAEDNTETITVTLTQVGSVEQ